MGHRLCERGELGHLVPILPWPPLIIQTHPRKNIYRRNQKYLIILQITSLTSRSSNSFLLLIKKQMNYLPDITQTNIAQQFQDQCIQLLPYAAFFCNGLGSAVHKLHWLFHFLFLLEVNILLCSVYFHGLVIQQSLYACNLCLL